MYTNFENLSEEKKKAILDVCIQEFAEKGYENASTNTIVKVAGISKGILFHYFKNKRGLFLYVLDYGLRIMLEEYDKYAFQSTGDIFQRLSEVSVIKLKITQTYPEISKLMVDALANSPEDIRLEVEKRYDRLSEEYMQAFFQDIDYSKFRSDVDPSKAIVILMLFLGALGDKYMKEYKGKGNDWVQNYDHLLEEYNGYMEILKYGMYSSEV